jgi:hypothetical protein
LGFCELKDKDEVAGAASSELYLCWADRIRSRSIR